MPQKPTIPVAQVYAAWVASAEYTPEPRPNSRRLQIDMVPEPLWGKTLKRLLPRRSWEELRRQVFQHHGEACSICASTQKPLDCDEVWVYDDATSVAHLVAVRPLCKRCHSHKHPRSASRFMGDTVTYQAFRDHVDHYMRINGCDMHTLNQDLRAADALWHRRSSKVWTVDFGPWQPFVTQPLT